MKSFVLGCLILVSAATTAQAQLSDAQVVTRLRAQPQAARVQEGCANKPVWVIGSTAGGAVAGWFIFTFGIGLLADDHGSEYKRIRNKFMLCGALLGLGKGLFDALSQECIRSPRPDRRPRGQR